MALSTSEWVPKFDPDPKTLITETNVQAQEDIVADVETKAETGRSFQTMEVDLGAFRGDFAGVEKQSHVESRERFPTIFGVDDDLVVVVEAVRPEPTKIIRSAENGLEIERNPLIGVGESQNRRGAQRNDPGVR